MTASPSYRPEVSTGFRMEQLASAFDRVMDSRDWQAPIHAVIQAEDRTLVEKAVLLFTESVASFEPAPGEGDRLVVRAPGFRRGGAAGS